MKASDHCPFMIFILLINYLLLCTGRFFNRLFTDTIIIIRDHQKAKVNSDIIITFLKINIDFIKISLFLQSINSVYDGNSNMTWLTDWHCNYSVVFSTVKFYS